MIMVWNILLKKLLNTSLVNMLSFVENCTDLRRHNTVLLWLHSECVDHFTSIAIFMNCDEILGYDIYTSVHNVYNQWHLQSVDKLENILHIDPPWGTAFNDDHCKMLENCYQIFSFRSLRSTVWVGWLRK